MGVFGDATLDEVWVVMCINYLKENAKEAPILLSMANSVENMLKENQEMKHRLESLEK